MLPPSICCYYNLAILVWKRKKNILALSRLAVTEGPTWSEQMWSYVYSINTKKEKVWELFLSVLGWAFGFSFVLFLFFRWQWSEVTGLVMRFLLFYLLLISHVSCSGSSWVPLHFLLSLSLLTRARGAIRQTTSSVFLILKTRGASGRLKTLTILRRPALKCCGHDF